MSNIELQSKVKELKELKLMAEDLEGEITALEDSIKAHMGEREEIIAGEYKIRWALVKSSRFDTAALKKAMPDIYSAFAKTTETRRFTVA